MEGLHLFFAIIFMHMMFFCFDVIFRSCSHVPYLLLLENTGFEIAFLRIRWSTTALNRTFQQWSHWKPGFQAVWFSLGIACSLLLMPVAAYLILSSLFASTSPEAIKPTGFVIEPVVPGINLPTSQLGNYMMALAVGGILHEMGHALAAAREGVPVLGCGVHLVLVLPVASVELSTQRLAALPTWRRLRVLCAGVWHNVVLALIALALLHAISHTPAYSLGYGIAVTGVDQGSGVSGPSGLTPGDEITGVDQCPIRDKLSWHQCLIRTSHFPQSSYCVPLTMISRNVPSKDGMCCGPESSRHLCFSNNKTRWCLKAREVIEYSNPKNSPCPETSHLQLTPEFKDSNNDTRLVVIHRSQKPVVIFLGNPKELRATVKTSDWIALISGLPLWLPEILSNVCSYIAALSAGLAVLNLLPCYGFDGQHITNLLVELLLSKCGVRSMTVASTMGAGFTAVGTGCLLAWLTMAVSKLVYGT